MSSLSSRTEVPGSGVPKFSIIVPIYNTSAYLPCCLASLTNQTFSDFEIVAVDDGSTDESGKIVLDLCNADERIRYFRVPNGGQGVARNYGLSKARGQYIVFVDSDDTVSPDLLKTANIYLEDPDMDVVSFGVEFRDISQRVVARRCPAVSSTSVGEEIFWDAMLDRKFLSSACNKVYRRTLLEKNAIRFPSIRAYEDTIFSRLVSLHAKKVLYLKIPMYFALTRTGSTSRGMSGDSFNKAIKMLSLQQKMFASSFEDPLLHAAFKAHAARFLAYLLILAAFRIDDHAERARCQEIINRSEFGECAGDGKALKLLGRNARLQVFLARHPRMLRMLAVIARKMGRSPY